ncbi:hypothetical protein [Dokdonia sp. Asnod1-B02]|uniref:hypothetical protein n=1 Tax=Dokdonia sp. Asnod1-B02 TaxID=3160573 RepID=UPI002633822D|nr:hypothetical protein [uncultured Dokdonia sp.]
MNNELLKHLFTSTDKVFNKHSDRMFDNFERADKIIIWIVGFAIGVFMLTIIRGNENEILENILFEICLFSIIIVILGLLFRVVSFLTQLRLSNILMVFSSKIAGMTTEFDIPFPREIKESDGILDIIRYLKEDFGIERPTPKLNERSDENIKKGIELYKKYYKSIADSNDVESQFKIFKKEFSEYFGYSQSYIDNKLRDEKADYRSGKIFRISLGISVTLYVLTIGTFILGSILIMIEVLNKL